MSTLEKFKLILGAQDHHGCQSLGRIKAKVNAAKLFPGYTVTLQDEVEGPDEGDITYSFTRKTKEEK